MLVLSSPNKASLEAAINKFYYSSNYFINENMKAENSKTKKVLGEVKIKKNRYQFHL